MPFLGNNDDDIALRSSDDRSQENVPTLIFPVNVHDSLQASAGLRKGEKVGIIVSFWVFGCALLAWFLAGWLRTVIPGYYGLIVLLVEVLLQLTVGVYILRFAMDERAMFAEMNESDLSFSNYFKIYKEIKVEDGSRYPFDLLEFDDGSYGVYIQFRFGHNTQLRSDATYIANKAIVDILDKAGLPRKVFFHNEAFKTSQAAQDLRDILKNVKDPQLFATYRDMVQNYLRIAEEESNVPCMTYLIYAPTRIAKDELVATVNRIFIAVEKDETVYREVSVLKYDQVVEFLRIYYRLEVLDMGIIRAHAAVKKNKYNCPVKVLKLYGRSGKIYANEEFKQLRKEIISEGGLERVN